MTTMLIKQEKINKKHNVYFIQCLRYIETFIFAPVFKQLGIIVFILYVIAKEKMHFLYIFFF